MKDAQNPNADLDIIKAHLSKIGEHFDTVQIFCTRHDPETEGGTINVSFGIGNFCARYGQAKLWVLSRESEERKFSE